MPEAAWVKKARAEGAVKERRRIRTQLLAYLDTAAVAVTIPPTRMISHVLPRTSLREEIERICPEDDGNP